MSEYIISQNCNGVHYAYSRGRFWRWDESAHVWKESHLLAQKFSKAKTVEKRLTPEAFLTSDEFIPMDDYELPDQMLIALRDAKPCKNAPIDPVEEESECTPAQNVAAAVTTVENAVPTATMATPITSESGADASASTPATSQQSCESAPAASAGGSSAPIPSAPSFDFGADEQTNALLLQDAQTFITGNMARIMAAKHAHDLCANNKNGTWGKWCDVVGISRDTGDNMVHIAERFGNIQIEGKPIFDVQPLKLLYAVAKPSAPAELVEQVKTGDITTYKAYQELLTQIKAEKDRADAAETREEEAWSMVSKAQDEARTAKNDLEVAIVDLNGLTKQNAKLQQSYHDVYESRIVANLQRLKAEAERDRAKERVKDAENQLAGSRQMAEAAKLRGDKLKAENDALKKQPITTVVDKEEVERQAREMAAEMTADLRAQLEQASSGSEQDAHSSYDNVLLADRALQNIGKMVVPSLRRLPPEQREQLTNMLVHTLGQIQGEVSRCL